MKTDCSGASHSQRQSLAPEKFALASQCEEAWFDILRSIQASGRGATLTWKLFAAASAVFMRHVTDAASVAKRFRLMAGGDEEISFCRPRLPIEEAAFELKRCRADRADAERLVQASGQLNNIYGFIATCEALFAVGCSAGVGDRGLASVRTYLTTLGQEYEALASREAAQATWH